MSTTALLLVSLFVFSCMAVELIAKEGNMNMAINILKPSSLVCWTCRSSCHWALKCFLGFAGQHSLGIPWDKRHCSQDSWVCKLAFWVWMWHSYLMQRGIYHPLTDYHPKTMKQVISDMFWLSTHGVSFLATLRVKFWGDSVTGISGELMSLSWRWCSLWPWTPLPAFIFPSFRKGRFLASWFRKQLLLVFYLGGGSCVTLCLRDVRTVIPVGPLLYRAAPSQSFAVCSFLVQANHSLANVTAGDRRQLSSSSSSLLSPLFYSYFYRCYWNGCCRNNVCTLIADLVGHQQSKRADLWLSYLALWFCCTWPRCPVWNPAMCLFVSLPFFSPDFRQSLASFYYLECSVRALAKSIMCQACWQKKGCTIDNAETCQVFLAYAKRPVEGLYFLTIIMIVSIGLMNLVTAIILEMLGRDGCVMWIYDKLPCNSWTCSYPPFNWGGWTCAATLETTEECLWNVLQRKHWKNEVRWRAKSKRIDTCSLDPCDPKKDTALRCSKFTSTHAWRRGLWQELQCQGPMPLQESPAVSPSHFPGRQFLDWSICSKPLTETFGRNDCVFGGDRSIKKTAKRSVQSSMSRAD